jgi:hypothetical protein
MKKLTTLFITALMVTGLTHPLSPWSCRKRAWDGKTAQATGSETVRGGFQGRYERGRNVHHGRHVYNRRSIADTDAAGDIMTGMDTGGGLGADSGTAGAVRSGSCLDNWNRSQLVL